MSSSFEKNRGIVSRQKQEENIEISLNEKEDEELFDQNLVIVMKWIDNSHNCGLGFQLSDESVGVVFNDESEIVAQNDGPSFYYYEKLKVSTTKSQEILSRYSFESFP